MASLNRVMLIGNLGSDPDVRYTDSGRPVCNFRVATSESWKDRDGNKQEHTEWHSVVVWGPQAESCGEYLKKGRSVYVEGKTKTRKWEAPDGQVRFSPEVIADRVQFLGGRDAPQQGGGDDSDIPF